VPLAQMQGVCEEKASLGVVIDTEGAVLSETW
jgi:hypothetical protein